MFRDKSEVTPMTNIKTDGATILKEDASFEGKLVFDGSVLINGKFNGEIYSSGELVVGRSGLVKGQVEIGTITVQGEVNGNIKASQKIIVSSPAVVRGDICAPSLLIEEGAVFEGNCSMGRTSQTSKAEANNDNVVGFAKTAEEDY